MRRWIEATVAFVALGLVSCQEQTPPQRGNELAPQSVSLLENSSDFTSQECPNELTTSAPAAGFERRYVIQAANGRVRPGYALVRVTESNAEHARAQMFVAMGDRPATPMGPVFGRHMAIPPGVSGDPAGRDVTYAEPPEPAIAGLQPGQVLILPAVETSRLGGPNREIADEIRVSHRGCGIVDLDGTPAAVLVFDVDGFGRSRYESDAGEMIDRVERNSVRYFVGEDGWTVREEDLDSGTTLIASPEAGATS